MSVLDNSVVSNFKVSKEIGCANNTDTVKNIDFSSDGNNLVSCTENGQISLYESYHGYLSRTIQCEKYGVDLIRFARSNDNVIHCSTKVNNNVRYLSLTKNKYIYYFPGHTKQVITLCMSPTEDYFVSGSIDNGLKLWDLRHPKCQGYMHLSGTPIATFDPEGLVLAVGVNSETLQLYDMRSYDKPFVSHIYPDRKHHMNWIDLKYNEDSRLILISTNGTLIRLINGFDCSPIQSFEDYPNRYGIPLEATISPNGRYVFSGASDGHVHVWNAVNGFKVRTLKTQETGAAQCLKFNPKHTMFVSARKNMSFWVVKNENSL